VIAKLVKENAIKEYDTINLEFGNFYLKQNIKIVNYNIAPTLLHKCDVAVVVSSKEVCCSEKSYMFREI
jgi:hypothetical protein